MVRGTHASNLGRAPRPSLWLVRRSGESCDVSIPCSAAIVRDGLWLSAAAVICNGCDLIVGAGVRCFDSLEYGLEKIRLGAADLIRYATMDAAAIASEL